MLGLIRVLCIFALAPRRSPLNRCPDPNPRVDLISCGPKTSLPLPSSLSYLLSLHLILPLYLHLCLHLLSLTLSMTLTVQSYWCGS